MEGATGPPTQLYILQKVLSKSLVGLVLAALPGGGRSDLLFDSDGSTTGKGTGFSLHHVLLLGDFTELTSVRLTWGMD